RSLRVRLILQYRETPHDSRHAVREERLIGQGNTAELKIVAYAQLGKYVATLRDINDPGIERLARCAIGNFATAKADRTRAHRQQAEHGLEHRRLAGPVRPDHGRDRAAPHPSACSV